MKLTTATTALLATACCSIRAAHAYCNWNGCNGQPQGGQGAANEEAAHTYCNANEYQCAIAGDGCQGTWCTNAFSYCTWSTCDGVIRSTEWCNALQGNCEGPCGGNWCTNGNGGGGGGPTTPTPPSPTPPSSPTTAAPPTTFNPNSGTATTTRYWDCSGGACGCAHLPFGPGTDGQPAHCHSNSLFAAPPGNAYGASFYGTAAISPALGGGNWLAEGCGKCWKVTGTSNISGKPVVETTLVLRGANYCPPENTLCGAGPHFDIAAPGFDVLQFSYANTCPEREPTEKDGDGTSHFETCGTWMIGSQNPDANCDCTKFNSPVLQDGCANFLGLHWDNPTVSYEELASCPPEMVTPCWEENGNAYPDDYPETCASPSSGAAPVAPPTPAPPTPVPPTPSPVDPQTPAPVDPQTPSPVDPQTPSPVDPQTPSPVDPQTPSPVDPTPAPPTPTPPTTGGTSRGYCCSHNFDGCSYAPGEWCDATASNCEGSCSGLWIDSDAIVPSCTPRDGECTDNVGGCCSPSACKGGRWYKQCKY